MRKFTVNVNGTKYEVEVEEFVQGSKVSENKTASEPLKASAPSNQRHRRRLLEARRALRRQCRAQ